MNVIQALHQLQKGKRIRFKGAEKHTYFEIVDGVIFDETGRPCTLAISDVHDLTEDDWELEPPASKFNIKEDERKALIWLRDGGVKEIYRADNNIIVSVYNTNQTIALYVPITQCLINAKWLKHKRLSIDTLLET